MAAEREPIDWTQTDKAKHDRRIKAAALADAARRLGVRDRDLQPGKGTRQPVRLEAGLSSVSEDTWILVHELLAGDEPPAPTPAPPRCSLGAPIPPESHSGQVHLYPGGLLCDAHAPWAAAGHPRPVAPPLSAKLAARRAVASAPALTHTVLDDRAIASGKRRATATTQKAARAAEDERRAREARARRRS